MEAFSKAGYWGSTSGRLYDMEEIRRTLTVRFEGTAFSTNSFVSMVVEKINQLNEAEKKTRINLGGANLQYSLPADVIYKFEVGISGRKQCFYKSYSQFAILDKTVV